jgi:hypothetical protein
MTQIPLNSAQQAPPVHTLRRAVVVVSVLGLLGLAAELVSVGHWYGPAQLIPFAMILLGVVAGLVYLIRETTGSRLLLRAAAVIVALGGVYGALQHNEKNPGLRQAGRAGENAMAAETRPGEPGLLGLPAPTPNALNGPAPLSAPLAMTGLGLLLFLSLYRREADGEGGLKTAPIRAPASRD